MSYNTRAIQLFQHQDVDDNKQLLIIGYEETLAKNLPKGSIFIDSSIQTIKYASSKFPDKSFMTKDLSTFSLQQKFHSILSLNKLHLVSNLKETFSSIEKHLLGDAYLYFPLSCDKRINSFLKEKTENNNLFKESKFNQKNRSDIEDAILQTPFDDIHIEEKTEYLSFYSITSLEEYLKKQLPLLCSLSNDELDNYAKDLSAFLYKNQDNDQVFTLSSPWILLSLSNQGYKK